MEEGEEFGLFGLLPSGPRIVRAPPQAKLDSEKVSNMLRISVEMNKSCYDLWKSGGREWKSVYPGWDLKVVCTEGGG